MAPDRGAEDGGQDDTSALLAVEDPMPIVPECMGNTAALFCVEDFGVTPPPNKGWVPRDEPGGGGSSPSKAEWFRNVDTSEWIWQSGEDMYYHLPSSSLWERRSRECSDPTLESFSYFRVDARALQALSRFALSLDVGLLPLAFKAWVRYMRRKQGGNRHFGVAAPPVSAKGPQEQREAEPDPASPAKAAGSPIAAELEVRPDRSPTAPFSPGDPTKSVAHAPAIIRDANQAMKKVMASRIFGDEEEEVLVEEPQQENELYKQDYSMMSDWNPMEGLLSADRGIGLSPQASLTDAEAALAAAKVEWTSDEAVFERQMSRSKEELAQFDQRSASKGSKRGGIFCLGCFRGGRGGRDGDSSADEMMPRGISEHSALLAAAAESGNTVPPEPDLAAAEAEAAKNDLESARLEATAQILSIEAVDRHMRKLDFFLDLVKRNPQKLVDHVEKRRQGRTPSLGIIVA